MIIILKTRLIQRQLIQNRNEMLSLIHYLNLNSLASAERVQNIGNNQVSSPRGKYFCDVAYNFPSALILLLIITIRVGPGMCRLRFISASRMFVHIDCESICNRVNNCWTNFKTILMEDNLINLLSISSAFLRANFPYESRFSSFFYVHVTRKIRRNEIRTKNARVKC